MGSPFTDEEKRFLLAEMIKVSRLDVDVLGNFIRANRVEPDWMHMQLPFGRNMTQCMQAADHIGIAHGQRTLLKRKTSDDQGELSTKRMALSGGTESPTIVTAAPSAAPIHVAILPRPSGGATETPSTLAPAPSSTAPKKKGRPARADKARFRPILPQHIAPRPIEQVNHNQPSQQPQTSQKSQSYTTPRTIVSTSSHNQDSTMSLPAVGNYSTSLAVPASGRSNMQRGGTPQDETAHPRVIVESAHEQFGSPRHTILPSPIPLEPEPRASDPGTRGSNHELTTLPPLLERDGKISLIGPTRVETQAPVTNSA